jgi:hypothetical protein
MASILANAFSEDLKRFYDEELFLRYVKPYLGIPLFRQAKPFIYEIEDY